MSGKLNKAQEDTLQSLLTAIGAQTTPFDEVTYTVDGSDNITTILFKLNSVTQITYTLSYTSGVVTGITKS